MVAGVIESVDPTTLVVAANIRSDVKLSREFISSIKQHGVLVPITVQKSAAGYDVIDGQRRTLAAVDAGLASVPVYVVAAIASEGERVLEQLVVNEAREGLSTAETVAAVKQLELFGMPLTAIAKKTGYAKKEVEVALGVGGSVIATKALVEHSLTLDEAAALVEFEDDPELVAQLVESAKRGQLAHTAQRFRHDRDEKAARQVVVDDIAKLGFILLEDAPTYEDTTFRKIAHIYVASESYVQVEESVIMAGAGDDLRAYPRKVPGEWVGNVRAEGYWEAGFAVTNWESHGWFAQSYGQSAPTGPKSEAEKQLGRDQREATKLWRSATVVRVAFLAELLQRKAPPSGWELLVAKYLTGYNTESWGGVIAALSLSHDGDSYSQRGTVEKALAANPSRAPHVAAGVVLGSIEGATDFDKKGWQREHTPAYLRQLIGWGYNPSEQEQALADKPVKS